jgi:hypothetical protein
MNSLYIDEIDNSDRHMGGVIKLFLLYCFVIFNTCELGVASNEKDEKGKKSFYIVDIFLSIFHHGLDE